MLRDFFYSIKRPLLWTLSLTIILFVLLFLKEGFLSAIFAGIKLAVFVFAPGIFVFKTIIPESEDLSVGFVGSSTGVIILGITYYIFGLFGIKFGLSIFLSPIIIIFIVILYLKLKRKVEVETGDYATKKS